MKTLDRYLTRQVLPVWVWCIIVFVFASCVIDLFEHLDDIVRYRIPVEVVAQYYLNFLPIVFVQASPLALLLSSAFVAMRLVRYQELLAMNAGGLSHARASVPFLFAGLVVSLVVFVVNEAIVPRSAAVYQRLRMEAFRSGQTVQVMENVTVMDSANRLYHAQRFDLERRELKDLTILEHDSQNRPKRSFYAQKALFTDRGLLLNYGTVTRLGHRGTLIGEPEPFVEYVLEAPVNAGSFQRPEEQPDTLRIKELQRLIERLKGIGIRDVRRYQVDLAAKMLLPFMNLVICLIGFVGPTCSYVRGRLKGLGISLGWGVLYYIGVAIGQGIGKEGLLPVIIAVWLPHVIAVGACTRLVRRAT